MLETKLIATARNFFKFYMRLTDCRYNQYVKIFSPNRKQPV